MKDLEADKGEEDSNQEEFEELQAELVKDFGKIKKLILNTLRCVF